MRKQTILSPLLHCLQYNIR